MRQCGTQFVKLLTGERPRQRLAQTDVGVANGCGPGVVANSQFIDGGGDVGGMKEVESPVTVFVLPRLPGWLSVLVHQSSTVSSLAKVVLEV